MSRQTLIGDRHIGGMAGANSQPESERRGITRVTERVDVRDPIEQVVVEMVLDEGGR